MYAAISEQRANRRESAPLTRESQPGSQQLGDLDGVQCRALAQIGARDEQRQAASVRPTSDSSPPAAASGVGTSTTFTPGAPSSSFRARCGESGWANSALIDNEWPVNTGTRTQVPLTSKSGIPRILRLS